MDRGRIKPLEIVNAYDNAVLSTDDFLASTIGFLAVRSSHYTAMTYMSGHGESLPRA